MFNNNNNAKMETTQFKVGNIYEMRFIGDSELRPQFACVKRTAKTATFKRVKGSESFTRKIKEYESVEYILSGSYSMAPSIRADKFIA